MEVFLLLIVCCSICVSHGEIDVEPTEPPPTREINISEIDNLVDTEEGRATLESEFETIKGGQRKPWTEAEKEENARRNRYPDLLAYDETRVRLPYTVGSDYINANYMDGFNRRKEYVATQGPLQNTAADFWAMVWHLKVKKIVMLANLLEHGKPKVAKYWPSVGRKYGKIMVTKVAEISFPRFKHVMRVFFLHKDGIARIVRHFHFTGWPDLGVPEDTDSIVSLMRQVRSYSPEDQAPIVIHCSAGIGRTGTVLLLDSMTQKAKRDDGVVDFPNRLDHMRLRRVDLVEKKEQYVFAHRAVNDFYNNNRTAAFMDEVAAEYRKAEMRIFAGVYYNEEQATGVDSL